MGNADIRHYLNLLIGGGGRVAGYGIDIDSNSHLICA